MRLAVAIPMKPLALAKARLRPEEASRIAVEGAGGPETANIARSPSRRAATHACFTSACTPGIFAVARLTTRFSFICPTSNVQCPALGA